MLNSQTTGYGEDMIIFVHGNSQSLHIWDEVVNQKGLIGYTRVAVDLPGHGLSFRSTDPLSDYSVVGLSLHLSAFLQRFAGKRYILVGSSLGTGVISGLNPFPAACRGAFLSGAMVSSVGLTVKDMLQPNVNVAAAFKAETTDAEIDQLIDLFIYKSNQEIREEYKDWFRQTDPNMREYLGKTMGSSGAVDKIANIISARIPIAVVYGAREKLVQPDYLDRTRLPKWRNKIFTIKDAGHCVEVNQPAALASLLGEFARDCFK